MSEIISTFNTDTDGWSIEGDVASFNWQATAGDPGGNLQWVDAVTGAESYWEAASKFLGNKVGYYGGSLSYAIEDTGSDLSGVPDVELTGDGMTLVATVGQAGTTWTSYSIALDASAGWTIGSLSGAVATEAQIKDVLGNLTQMLIRAEFVDGDESGGLDNVVLASSGSVTAKTWLDGSDDWNTPADWSGGTVPGASSNVIIAQGDPKITGPITAHSITVTGSGTGVTVAADLHYAGVFTAAAKTVLTLSGSHLILTGNVSLRGATVSGSGTLYAEKSTVLSGLTIGGTVQFENIKSLTQSGETVSLGDASGSVAKLYNTSTGTYAITDDSDIGLGHSTKSLISNSGTFEKTGGTGVSTVAPAIVNGGTIKALIGTLDLQGAITGTGAMTIGSGATLELDAAVSSTQVLSFAGTHDTLLLKDVAGFKGTVAGLVATDTIDLAGLSITGTKAYYTPNSGDTGGTLIVKNATTRDVLTLDGQFVASGFHVAKDSAGTGTDLTYSSPSHHVAALAVSHT